MCLLQILPWLLGNMDVTLWIWNHCHVSSCFVGYITLNRWTVRHGLSAAIFKKKKVHRYTYLNVVFFAHSGNHCLWSVTETKWSVCIHAYMCIKLYKIYLNMHMGIVRVMSVKYVGCFSHMHSQKSTNTRHKVKFPDYLLH